MAKDPGPRRPLGLHVESGTAYEALLALGIAQGEVPETRYTEGRALVARYIALPAALRRLLSSLDAGSGEGWFSLVPLVSAAEPPRGVAELARLIESIDPAELKRTMLGSHRPELRGETLAGPLARLAAVEVKSRLLAALQALPAALYLPHPGVAQELAESADAARRMARRRKPELVVERMTRGIVYQAEPGIDQLLLVPTAIHRPWTLVQEHDRTQVFCYPVQPDAHGQERDLAAVYRALGDETRLRMLRRLAAGRATFGQLAREMGMAKSTIHHHALLLRTAGLVRLHLGSSGLELAGELPALEGMLRQYLQATPEPAEPLAHEIAFREPSLE